MFPGPIDHLNRTTITDANINIANDTLKARAARGLAKIGRIAPPNHNQITLTVAANDKVAGPGDPRSNRAVIIRLKNASAIYFETVN